MFSLGCFPYEMKNKRASTIRSFVNGTLKTFGLALDSEKFVVTNNEPIMTCTFNTDCKRIGCSDHYINKQLQHTFTTKTIDEKLVDCDVAQELFNNAKIMVSNIRRSHKQQNLSKKLILYADTRFYGAYAMLNVFSSIFDELVQILDSKLLTTYSRINDDFLLDICRFLLPFDTVIKALSKRLDEKWELADEHLIAAVLHPNNKHLHKSPHLKECAILLLKQEMFKRHDRFSSTTTSTVAGLPDTLSTTSSTCSSSISSTSVTKFVCLDARDILLMEVFDKPPSVSENIMLKKN
ncbi:unnamed protein product [Rotaria sp. Silwood2]|nr:unnamed protein product [Rotaria sp. Silwood2]CAF3154388.1 unnamed protein product [Rotaria sp. Silwood2]CAF4575084.1 unnamed protein product [Rotaria sp. Silwood2]CAF4810981.1 unnamed protein product [Rotaria sp. Silwood2]